MKLKQEHKDGLDEIEQFRTDTQARTSLKLLKLSVLISIDKTLKLIEKKL